jgi:hypothetical protein
MLPPFSSPQPRRQLKRSRHPAQMYILGEFPVFGGRYRSVLAGRRGPRNGAFDEHPPHDGHTTTPLSPTTFVQPTTHHPPPGRMVSRGPACLPPPQKADRGGDVRHHRDEAPTRGAHIRVILWIPSCHRNQAGGSRPARITNPGKIMPAAQVVPVLTLMNISIASPQLP